MSETPFLEVKRTIAGTERRFDCEAIFVSSRLAVVKFIFIRPVTIGGTTHEAGGWTEGFFWRRRNYNLYHIVSREGVPLADRFDVIDHVRIQPRGVRYDDLLLDLWLYPNGEVLLEDEDEVQQALAAGQLSQPRLEVIRRTEKLLLDQGRRIVDRALGELALLRA